MLGALGAKDILIQLKGDNKNLKNAMTDSDKSMDNLVTSVKKYGPAMAAAFVVGTAALVSMTVKMAAAEETVNRQTESMLKSQGIMWSDVKDEVTDYINELEKLTTYGDTDLQMAFNRMSSSGMGYASTMESMKMVTDIAYTRNISLVAAADLVAKAYNGQGSALKRYGIILEDGVTGLEALIAMQVEVAKNFADSTDAVDTYEGSARTLTNTMDDFKEAIGAEMVGSLTNMNTMLTEGIEGADSYASSIGKILNFLIETPVQAQRLEPLGDELIKILKLQSAGLATDEDIIRKHKIIIQMMEIQNGEYDAQKKYVDDIKDIDEDILEVEESLYFVQLRKMGATEEYIALKKQELVIDKDITAEGEKQLSMRERAAQKRTEIQRARTTGTSLTGLSGSAAAYAAGEAYTRQSGAITITNPGKSGAP